MQSYYCLIDPVKGLKGCGLNVTAEDFDQHHIQPKKENKTVTVKNLKNSDGYSCYYHFKAIGDWNENSTVHIYPNDITSVDAFMISGETR